MKDIGVRGTRTRRSFVRCGILGGIGWAALGAELPLLSGKNLARASVLPSDQLSKCPFRLAVINDEITQDFEKACRIAANDFGLEWIEVRSMWNKNVTTLNDKEVAEAVRILAEHRLRVTDIASPLFKTDWPGAPISKLSETRDQFHANFDSKAQDQLLERCISVAKSFGTDRIRCFDFWRLDDQKLYRTAINTRLQQAAERCA